MEGEARDHPVGDPELGAAVEVPDTDLVINIILIIIIIIIITIIQLTWPSRQPEAMMPGWAGWKAMHHGVRGWPLRVWTHLPDLTFNK